MRVIGAAHSGRARGPHAFSSFFENLKLNGRVRISHVSSLVLTAILTWVAIELIAAGSSTVRKLTAPKDIDAALQKIMSARVCGSPAVDAYASLDANCMKASPAAQWWAESKPEPNDLVIHIERRADYDGIAVAWGIDNKMKDVEECAEACRNHKPNPDDLQGFTSLPCNAFVYCTVEVCYEPDAHRHTKGDCWLKFTEGPAAPEVNMRGMLSPEALLRHPNAPQLVQWHAGVVLPKRTKLTNGTWSPRYNW